MATSAEQKHVRAEFASEKPAETHDTNSPNAKRQCPDSISTSFLIDTSYSAHLRQLPFPEYRQPKEIGSFSMDCNRGFRNDERQLKYLHLPPARNPIEFDLNDGYESHIARDESKPDYLDAVLMWILHNLRAFQVQQEPDHSPRQNLRTDFICFRGLLTRLVCTLYEKHEGWIVSVTKHNGTNFMREFPTSSKLRREADASEREKRMCYWGHRFEPYITSDQPKDSPKQGNHLVNLNEEYGTVVRSRLKSHSLVMFGEVDCIDPGASEKERPACYVELKTSRLCTSHRQSHNFKRFKVLKWWAQSYLVGIPCIICGMRDDRGVVRKLESFKVKDLPKMGSCLGDDSWMASVCMNFLDEFLAHIKATVTSNDPKSVYVFEWDPTAVHRKVTCQKYDQNSKYYFMPPWFAEEMENPSTPSCDFNGMVPGIR